MRVKREKKMDDSFTSGSEKTKVDGQEQSDDSYNSSSEMGPHSASTHRKSAAKGGPSGSRKSSSDVQSAPVPEPTCQKTRSKWPKALIWLSVFGILMSYLCLDTSRIRQAQILVCSFPATSDSPMCQALHEKLDKEIAIQGARVAKLASLQTQFEGMMENVGFGTYLATNMKKSEMAVRDLNGLIKRSNLKSKDQLVPSMDLLISSTKDCVERLGKLDAKIGGAVDSILAIDDYAIKTLEHLDDRDKSKNSLSSSWGDDSATEILSSTFERTFSTLEHNLKRLVMESQGTLGKLNDLEVQLEAIDNIVSHEEWAHKKVEKKVLEELWSKLGFNKAKLANFSSHAELLSKVSTDRDLAARKVSATLLQLQQLQYDLENVRHHFSDSVGNEEDTSGVVPLQVHIQVLRGARDRLTEGRAEARKRRNLVLDEIFNESS